jgi:hypothetical protein
MLKVTTETVRTVNYNDFETFVLTEYGHEFSVAEDTDSGNDTTVRFDVSETKALDEWDQQRLAAFRRAGRGSYLTQTILQDAVNRGLIPHGVYNIRISW